MAVIVSIFTLEHPNGAQYTPAISPTVQCVINLCCQFFFAYLGIWVCITIKEFTGMQWPLLTDTLQSCLGTVMFCPILAILFVGTRMRALQMTNNKGAPQGWAQDGMYLATWSLFLQFWMVVLASACTGEKAKTDEDGNVTWKPNNIYAFYGRAGDPLVLGACSLGWRHCSYHQRVHDRPRDRERPWRHPSGL